MEVDHSIEIMQLRLLFKKLQQAPTVGKVFTIVIPPQKIVNDYTKKIQQELTNIKLIQNEQKRDSLTQICTEIHEKLKTLGRAPDNGLVLLGGKIIDKQTNQQKKIMKIIEPYKQINLSIYCCEEKFNLNSLRQQLTYDEDDGIGFIQIEQTGATIGMIRRELEAKYKMTVKLPKKHGRGGASSIRFARLRAQKRHNYLKKICEKAKQIFFQGGKWTICKLVVGSCGDFKKQLLEENYFNEEFEKINVQVMNFDEYESDILLKQIFEKVLNTSPKSALFKEKQIVNNFYDGIADEDDLVIYGVEKVIRCVEQGIVKRVLCSQQLNCLRFRVQDIETKETKIVFKKQENFVPFMKKHPNLQVIEQEKEEISLIQWLVNHYQQYGCQLKFIANNFNEGMMFQKGFSGLAAHLKHKMTEEQQEGSWEEDDDSIFA